jgi:acyl carrier protein
MAVAQWLAEQGARHLLLVGRSRPKPEVQAQLDALTEKGVTVTVAQADVAIHSELEAALNRIDGRYPLRGLIHSVGVLDDGTLLRLDWTRFEKILTPKMAGAWHLHHLTRQLPLDFFILFSSAASMLGSRGQANHAAANAFLDSFAHFRQAQGLPGLSINWGAWSEVGAAVSVVRSGYTAAQGFGEIEPQQGLRCLGWLLAGDAPQLGVIPIKWKQFLGATDSPFYQEFYPLLEPLGSTSGSQEPSPGLFADIRQHIASAPASDRQAILLQYLCAAVAKVLRLDPEQLDPHLGLVEMGLDSLMAIELRNRVQKELTIELPVTAYLDNSSIARIGELILADHFQSDEATLVGQGTTNRKDDSPPEPGTPPAATGKTRVRL